MRLASAALPKGLEVAEPDVLPGRAAAGESLRRGVGFMSGSAPGISDTVPILSRRLFQSRASDGTGSGSKSGRRSNLALNVWYPRCRRNARRVRRSKRRSPKHISTWASEPEPPLWRTGGISMLSRRWGKRTRSPSRSQVCLAGCTRCRGNLPKPTRLCGGSWYRDPCSGAG